MNKESFFYLILGFDCEGVSACIIMTLVIWIKENQFGLEKLIKMENFNPIFQSGLKIFNPNFIKIENFNPNISIRIENFQSGLRNRISILISIRIEMRLKISILILPFLNFNPKSGWKLSFNPRLKFQSGLKYRIEII